MPTGRESRDPDPYFFDFETVRYLTFLSKHQSEYEFVKWKPKFLLFHLYQKMLWVLADSDHMNPW